MKILVVLPRFPYPLEKGDKLRAYHQVVELSKRHEVYLFCLSHTAVGEENMKALLPYCKEIHIERLNRAICGLNVVRNYLHARSLQIGYWTTRKAKRAYKNFEAKVQPDVVYNQMIRTMPYVAKSKRPKVMDFQDALSMNLERRMEKSRGLLHYVLHYEFMMVRSAEYDAFTLFDALTIISDTDADAIPHKRNLEIAVVPNGVDFDYFAPRQSKKTADVVFTGNMSYAPNVSAAQFLVEKVMPTVWEKRPQTTVQIVGAAPKHSVRKLADGERVIVRGYVDDIRDAYAGARLFVAPMLIGSGLQNKLLEAMSMRVPCITTSIANAALGAENGKELLVADDEQSTSEAIVTLLNNESEAEVMAERGYEYVHRKYGWPAAVEKLEKILNEVYLEKR